MRRCLCVRMCLRGRLVKEGESAKKKKRERVEWNRATQSDRKENRERTRERAREKQTERGREHKGPIQHNNPDSPRFHYANAYFKASPS